MLLVFLNGEEASFMPDMNSDGERAGFGTRFPTRETGSGRERGRSEGKGIANYSAFKRAAISVTACSAVF